MTSRQRYVTSRTVLKWMMTKRIHLRHCVVIMGLMLLASCENITLVEEDSDETDDKQNTESVIPPATLGKGTKDAPYTVRQVQNLQEVAVGDKVWVIAYAVGETYRSLGNACFEPPFEYTSNMLVSGDRFCSDIAYCMPVELSTSAQKTTLALSNHPEHHRDCVMLQGTIQKFFGVTGIRQLSKYYWLHDFTIPTSDPTTWEEEWMEY